MGAGTDLTQRAGNVIVLGNRLTRIPWLVALGRQTRRIIRQNLAWALGYNGVALAAAAMGWLHPLVAAIAMVVSSLTVLGNSIRLQRFPDSDEQPIGHGSARLPAETGSSPFSPPGQKVHTFRLSRHSLWRNELSCIKKRTGSA